MDLRKERTTYDLIVFFLGEDGIIGVQKKLPKTLEKARSKMLWIDERKMTMAIYFKSVSLSMDVQTLFDGVKKTQKSQTPIPVEFEALLYIECGDIKRQLNEMDDALRMYRKAAKLVEFRKDIVFPEHVQFELDQGFCELFVETIQWKDALCHGKLLYEKLKTFIVMIPDRFSYVEFLLARMYSNLKDYENAEIHLKSGRRIARKNTEKLVDIVNIYSCSGILARRQGDNHRALKYFSKCRELFLKYSKEDDWHFRVEIQSNFASMLKKTGQFQKAYDMYEEALNLYNVSSPIFKVGNHIVINRKMASLAYELKQYEKCVIHGKVVIDACKDDYRMHGLILPLIKKLCVSAEKSMYPLDFIIFAESLVTLGKHIQNPHVPSLSPKLKCTCGKPAPLYQCGACHKIYYCSKECQKVDWKEHKKNCTK